MPGSIRCRAPARPASNVVDVDYDTYAAGEAALGWLNASVALRTDESGGLAGVCRRSVGGDSPQRWSLAAPRSPTSS